MTKTHKDVEFHVGEHVFKKFDEAAAHAVAIAATRGRTEYIDVVIWSRAGARAWGDVETYDEDPDASVFERIEVKAHSLGRIA